MVESTKKTTLITRQLMYLFTVPRQLLVHEDQISVFLNDQLEGCTRTTKPSQREVTPADQELLPAITEGKLSKRHLKRIGFGEAPKIGSRGMEQTKK